MPKRKKEPSRTTSEAQSSVHGTSDDEDLDISDGYESSVTELESDEEDGDFEIDAIRYAVYRDSRPDRGKPPHGDGWEGWHYTVMWAGYLKTQSDSEERVKNFGSNGTILPDFWKTYKKASLRRGQKEPDGKIGDRHDPPDSLLERWFIDSDPRRSLSAYKRRQGRRGRAATRVLKADSDYYIAKARKKREEDIQRKAKRKASNTAAKSPAPPKTSHNASKAADDADLRRKSSRPAKISSADVTIEAVTRIASSSPPPTKSSRKTPSLKRTLKGKSPERSSSLSPDELDILNSDHEVDAVLGDEPDRESPASPGVNDEPLAVTQAGRKRKRDTSTNSGPSESKDQKVARPGAANTLSVSKPLKAKRDPREESRGSINRQEVEGANARKGREGRAGKEVDEDDQIIRRTAAPGQTKSSMLAKMGKIRKRPAPTDEIIVVESSTTPPIPSETFGSPQPGIFDDRQQTDRELAGEGSTSPARTENLFTDYQENEEVSVARAPHERHGRRPIRQLSHDSFVLLDNGPTNAAKPARDPSRSGLPGRSLPDYRRPPRSRNQSPAANLAAPMSSETTGFNRPKYVQGSKLKTMDAIADPEPNHGSWKRKQQPVPTFTGEVHVPLALRPALDFQIRQPASSNPEHSPTFGQTAQRTSAYVPRAPASAAPTPVIPTGPRSWKPPVPVASIQKPPKYPSNTPAARNSGPLPPLPPRATVIPVEFPPYSASKDPRRARHPPRELQFSPPPERHLSPAHHDTSTAYPSPLSPSRQDVQPPSPVRAAHPSRLSPPLPLPLSPAQIRAQEATLPQLHETIGACCFTASVTPANMAVTCDIRLLRGSPSRGLGDINLAKFARRKLSSHTFCETAECFCLLSQVKNHGSVVLEWAKVICGEDGPKEDYDIIVKLAHGDQPKVFATYFESPSPQIDRHYAFVIAASRHLDFSGWRLDRGRWTGSDLGLVALLVSLPLDRPPPLLPSPVDPEMDVAPSQIASTPNGAIPLLSSYQLETHLRAARHQSVQYPPKLGDTQPTDLSVAIRHGFEKAGAVANGDRIDVYVVENVRLSTAMIPLEPNGSIPCRTTILAVGPSLSLLPSHWKARPIWNFGGLITFSPTFILRSPELFSDVISIVRAAQSWSAYVIPSVLEWGNESWNSPQAYDSLTRTLNFDSETIRLSGEAAHLWGGLAISITPPSCLLSELAEEWISWYQQVADAANFDTKLQYCRGVRPGKYETIPRAGFQRNQSPDRQSLNLDQIERSQLEDMADMRMRPDVSYRRYLYIGETSLDNASKSKFTGQGIEFVSYAAFKTLFGKSL